MKRIVILIDGTWGQEGSGVGTNVAQLDPANRAAGPRLIIARGADGLEQRVMYHAGVGADPDLLKHLLGGSIGLGLKQMCSMPTRRWLKRMNTVTIFLHSVFQGVHMLRGHWWE
jgi:hypothetical protein